MKKREQIGVGEILVPTPPGQSTVEQLMALQQALSQLEGIIQAGNIILLKIQALLLSSYPEVTLPHVFVVLKSLKQMRGQFTLEALKTHPKAIPWKTEIEFGVDMGSQPNSISLPSSSCRPFSTIGDSKSNGCQILKSHHSLPVLFYTHLFEVGLTQYRVEHELFSCACHIELCVGLSSIQISWVP